MMRRFFACGIPILLAIGSLAGAAEVRGIVTKVDPEKKEIVLEARGRGARGTMTFVVDKDTQVLFGRVAGALNELATGKRVRIDYQARDGKLVVTTILAPPGAKATTVAKLPDNAFAGTLQRVALTDREIVVVNANGKAEDEKTFAVTDDTKITKSDKPVKLDDLKEGDKVAVVGEKRDGKLVAATVQVGGTGLSAGNDKSRINRLRTVLQMLDQFLEMAEKRGSKP